jgi:Secretion system C-terminal sorting domain
MKNHFLLIQLFILFFNNSYTQEFETSNIIWSENFDSINWKNYTLGEGPNEWEFYFIGGIDGYFHWADSGPRGKFTSPNSGQATVKDDLLPKQLVLSYFENYGASINNGFFMLEADYARTNSDCSLYTNSNNLTSWVQLPAFDFSSNENIILSFKQLYRYCCQTEPSLLVQITSSFDTENPDNTEWIEIDCNPQAIRNIDSNQEQSYFEHDISNFVAGKQNVIIRFYFIGSHYYWLIDDIEIKEGFASTANMLNNYNLEIFPNPVIDILTVNNTNISNGQFNITDIVGRSYKINYNIIADKTQINCAHLSKGLYFLTINGLTTKFYKK